MMPKIVICDPELTVGMLPPSRPARASTRSPIASRPIARPAITSMADGIAVEGHPPREGYLPRAYKDGRDIEARANMMSAAAMGATAFQKGLGAIHALSHPAGALYDTHHGLTNAVFMPYVLLYNRAAIERKIERLAAYIGLEPSFQAFLDWVLNLRRDLGVPHTLEGLKIDAARFDEMSAMAPEDPTAGGNPVPITKESARRPLRGCADGTSLSSERNGKGTA